MSRTATLPPPIAVHLAHDHEPAVAALPGMDLGPAELREAPSAAAARWFREGIRKVSLPDLVDLGAGPDDAADADAVRRLVLVRELTSHGIAVDWRLRLPGEDAAQWRVYSHLQVPTELVLAPECPTDPREALAQWRESFYIDKCSYRHGPGFVQVRDRRSGALNLLTIDDPAYLAVFAMLVEGAPLAAVDLPIAREFGEEGLVAKVGDQLVWLPYRLRRWPLPAMSI